MLQSEYVVLEVQDEDEVSVEAVDEDLLSSFSCSRVSMMFASSVRYSDSFSMTPSISLVILVASSGMVLVIPSTIGDTQLTASPTRLIAAAVSPTAMFAALDARFSISPTSDLFLKDPAAQGDVFV